MFMTWCEIIHSDLSCPETNKNMQLMKRDDVVLGVDVGTTNIRCYAYDRFANVIGKADKKINLLNLNGDRLEISPDNLWENFQSVIKNCLQSSHLDASEISCVGISTQRGTFLTWDKETGEPFHNFICWKDMRAEEMCNKWNSSKIFTLLRYGAFLLYLLTRKTKFQVYSALKFSSAMVLMRLYWILEHNAEIRVQSAHNRVLFGTIDTWLLWKLTGGKVHATDTSNACVTGFFDPFKMEWIKWIFYIFNIPQNILPDVRNTCDSFGVTLPSIFGSSIPICSLVGDQQASTFGAGCFKKFDVNCTMGTGSFLDMNTGSSPSVSQNDILPLVGWTINSKTTYIAECGIHEAGNLISWIQNLGLFDQPNESSSIAESVSDSGGVYFLPAINASKNSIRNKSPSSAFIGIKTHTSKEQVVRSVLEALTFQVCLLWDAVLELYGSDMRRGTFRISGGVAKNDFIVQLISDTTVQCIQRLKHSETSSLGAALLAGLHYGVWKSQDDLISIQKDYDTFYPRHSSTAKQSNSFLNWKKAFKLIQEHAV